MRGLQKCGRKDCPTIEVPNSRWWVVGSSVGYGDRRQAHFMMHDPAIPLLSGEKLVCGEACLTRELAGWTAGEQSRRRREERQAEILAGIEKQFEKQL